MLLAAVLILRSNGNNILMPLVYTAPSALFPIMALFIWLDSERYRAYLPLFTAGKCIGITSLLGWSIVSSQFTMIGVFMTVVVFAEFVILCGDLLAMAAVFLVFKNNKKNDEINAVTDTEGNVCE
jgi:hypothetical protein